MKVQLPAEHATTPRLLKWSWRDNRAVGAVAGDGTVRSALPTDTIKPQANITVVRHPA